MELNFNIRAFLEPKTQAEYARLLDEAVMIANDLLEDIARIDRLLEANAATRAVA